VLFTAAGDTQEIAGGVRSLTVTICTQKDELLLTSTAVHVTTVVPTGYVPLASSVPLKSLVKLAIPQLSSAVG